MDAKRLSELRYVKNYGKPIWGAVLARGGPDNAVMQMYLDEGLIRPAGDQGYVLTRKAEQLIDIEAERKEQWLIDTT